ncbi:hypothetical protein GCM10010412_084620 [Nonomuraea recticatena]|uniref:Uncharacterized protein n=1 Tax=Nonomuraea recticatena TaxID=46178 RepID=A0ABN3T4R2_9ACTN
MACVIERADQLVLDYVSKAADAAHGVLRQDHRLDFVQRLRARIESERSGSEDPKVVARVLARFGDPAALVEREARRLSSGGEVPRIQAEPEVRPAESDTAVFPRVVDDVPPGVARGMREARERLTGRTERGLPFAGLRRAVMAGANPMATGGRDARTVVKGHPREVLAIGLLLLAALLVPMSLPSVAIFQVPVIVWAAGAATVLTSDSWSFRDRMIGIGAPMFGYGVGGVVIGALRVGGESGLSAFLAQFYAVSGIMFMIFTGLGVVWLAYRLWDLS